MRLVIALGTRPEIIKLAPIVHLARRLGHETRVVATGQHRELVRPLLEFFEIQPDLDLDVMTPNQTLTSLSARILEKLDQSRSALECDAILVQGDTTTAFMAGYWGFCHRIPVAHVEAGLRTGDLSAPFPEEANRQLLGRIAQWHFAPTSQARDSLLRENVTPSVIHVVGNTGIDALQWTLQKLKEHPGFLPSEIQSFAGPHPLVLVTAHRRESFGPGFEGICRGILQALEETPDLRVVYPMHPNPNVRRTVEDRLSNHPRILLCEPLAYPGFVSLMERAQVLLTDSGGIQEEGPTLRKPILVMRESTERPEGIQAGFAKLVGTNPGAIARETRLALREGCTIQAPNPYGDGKASERILETLSVS